MITTLILDRGHATLDKDGKYVTPGKQFVFNNGLHVYEGLENQKYVECLAKKAIAAGFKVEYTVLPNDPKDPSLVDRVKKANALKDAKNALYISVHNNAGGGVGTEVFTSVGNTGSDKFAESILFAFKSKLRERVLRLDTKDGDMDKEENFYVLRATNMPAVLLEIGFFDNATDYAWLSDPDNIDSVCDCIISAVLKENAKK